MNFLLEHLSPLFLTAEALRLAIPIPTLLATEALKPEVLKKRKFIRNSVAEPQILLVRRYVLCNCNSSSSTYLGSHQNRREIEIVER